MVYFDWPAVTEALSVVSILLLAIMVNLVLRRRERGGR